MAVGSVRLRRPLAVLLVASLLALASGASGDNTVTSGVDDDSGDELSPPLPPPQLQPVGNATTADIVKQLLLFDVNTTRCQMYSKSCAIRLVLTNSERAPMRRIHIAGSDSKFLNVLHVEQCFANSTKKECAAFLLAVSATASHPPPSNHDFYLIYVRAKLVGVKAMVFVVNVSTAALPSSLSSSSDNQFQTLTLYHRVVISRPERFIDSFQMGYIVFFSCIMSVIMGILLDVESILMIIHMPVAVLIGFISQYVIMPLLAFAFIKIFQLPPVESLALFIYGCSPGGSGSNNWTIIFNGDIDLSAIMTFVSTMSSLFMMPLWLYTLGTQISSKAQIKLPFFRLILNLLFTIIPCLFGLFLSRKFPRLKKFMIRITKRLVVCLIVSFLMVTIAAKYFIFELITWQQWVAGPLIPWSGFLLGAGLAYIAKRPLKQIYTISIETGLQNVGIAFMIVMINLPSPESDYALLPLVAVSFLTNLPLWAILLVKTVAEKYSAYKYKRAECDDITRCGDDGGGSSYDAIKHQDSKSAATTDAGYRCDHLKLQLKNDEREKFPLDDRTRAAEA